MKRMLTTEEINQIKQNASDIDDIKSKYNLIENIKDADGNLRFVEGDVPIYSTFQALGFSHVYGRWSLSGTHLMIVFVFKNNSGNDIAVNEWSKFFEITLPEYISNKIFPMESNVVTTTSLKGVNAADAPTPIDRGNAYLEKHTNQYECFLRNGTSDTTIKDGDTIRIQMDLIIDNASE